MTDSEVEAARREGELIQTTRDHARRIEQLEGLVKWGILGILSALGSAGIQLIGTIIQVKK